MTSPVTTSKLMIPAITFRAEYIQIHAARHALLASTDRDICASFAWTPVNSSMLIVRSPRLARSAAFAYTRTSLNNFFFPPLIGNLGQPIPEAVRLQSPFLSR